MLNAVAIAIPRIKILRMAGLPVADYTLFGAGKDAPVTLIPR
jgi:hypothetical protein